MKAGRCRSAGFTLVELLVSLSVSVGILAGAYLCLHGGLQSRKLCEQRMDFSQKARVALALMAADLECACTLSEKCEFLGMKREIGDMEADNLDFITHNWRPRSPGEGDLCEVSWYADRNPKTGELGLWRRRDPSPDDDPLDGGFKEEIAEGLAALRFEYYDGFTWYDNWGETSAVTGKRISTSLSTYNLGGLPEAVRITVAFDLPGRAHGTGPAEKPGIATGELRSPGASSAVEPKGGPAPLFLQTVVRLNLAGRVNKMLSGGAGDAASPSTSSTETEVEKGAEGSPGGGRP